MGRVHKSTFGDGEEKIMSTLWDARLQFHLSESIEVLDRNLEYVLCEISDINLLLGHMLQSIKHLWFFSSNPVLVLRTGERRGRPSSHLL